MAGKTLNRRNLRKQAEQSVKLDTPAETPPVTPQKKAKKAPAVRKPRAAKVPPRMRARWCIYDGSMKPVAVFDYNQRAAADAKLADLAARAKGVHFLQVIKEPMPEPQAAPVTG